MSAVGKYGTSLLSIERNIVLLGKSYVVFVYKSGDKLVAHDRLVDYLFAIFEFYLGVQPAHWVYSKQRTKLAKTVATTLFDANSAVVNVTLERHLNVNAFGLTQFDYAVIYLVGTACKTTRTGANQDLFLLIVKVLLARFSKNFKFDVALKLFHFLSP